MLANPKVLAVNKQRGEVIVGRRDGYLTTIVTETQSVQDVEYLEIDGHSSAHFLSLSSLRFSSRGSRGGACRRTDPRRY